MTIHEKLERLLKFASRKAVAEAAGIRYGTFHAALSKRSPLSIACAASLARTIGVDLGWLVDDSRGWPPVRIESLEHEPSAAA